MHDFTKLSDIRTELIVEIRLDLNSSFLNPTIHVMISMIDWRMKIYNLNVF